MRVLTTAVTDSPITNTDKVDVQAAIAATRKDAPTFAEIRAALPTQEKRDRMADGMIHQTAIELGLDVAL